MDFWDAVGRVLRRWYLTLPLLAGVAYAAVQVSSEVEGTWHAETDVLVAPSSLTESGAAVNPLLRSGKATLSAASEAVVAQLVSPALREARGDVAPSADVTFEFDPEAPIVRVDVVAADAAQVDAASALAVEQMHVALDAIQDDLGAPAADRIQVHALTEPVAEEQSADTVRVFAGVIAAGLIAVLLVVLALDQLLVRRRARRLASEIDVEAEQLFRHTARQ